MLKGGFETLNEWLGIATDLLKSLVVIGIVVGTVSYTHLTLPTKRIV